MGPNLDFLAVSNQDADVRSASSTSDPTSSNFHKRGQDHATWAEGPRGIAWDPGNEDILVCNEQREHRLHHLGLRLSTCARSCKSNLNQSVRRDRHPAAVRTSASSATVYFAWILNRNGDLSTLIESGPERRERLGLRRRDRRGADDRIETRPKKIYPDFYNVGGSVCVDHPRERRSTPTGTPTGQVGGAITQRLRRQRRATGKLPLFGFELLREPAVPRHVDRRAQNVHRSKTSSRASRSTWPSDDIEQPRRAPEHLARSRAAGVLGDPDQRQVLRATHGSDLRRSSAPSSPRLPVRGHPELERGSRAWST